MYCKNCGKEITGDKKVCDFCGEKNDFLFKIKDKILSNKKITIIGSICLIALLILVIVLTETSKGINKNDIKKYYLENDCLDKNEVIKGIEIVSKEETEDGKLKISTVIVTEDGECRYTQEGGVICYKSSKGWEIQNVFSEHSSDYDVEPLKGISEKNIKETLDGTSVTIDNEIWTVSESNISNIKIKNQNTNLKEKKDSLSVSIIIDDSVQQAKVSFNLKYSFDRKWNLEKLTENGKFTVSTKPGKELNITEEDIISDLDQKKLKFGNDTSSQDFTIKKNELSDLKINEKVITDKGKSVNYICSATVTKDFSTFYLDVSIAYYYSQHWEFQNFSATAKCESVNINGTLQGTNTYGWPCRLVLSSFDTNGNISGSYYYDGYSGNKGHSFNVSGNLDLKTFKLRLEPGTIISKPFSFYKAHTLEGYLDIEKEAFVFYDDSQKITLGLNQ